MFYQPLTLQVKSTPVIVYPCQGIEELLGQKDKKSIKRYLDGLYAKNHLTKNGEYNVVILWNDKTDIMADVWIYDRIESWGSGPLVDVRIFRNGVPEKRSGVSAGDGLVLLGLEEQQRWKCVSLKGYLHGPRPKLPKKISVGKNFYK